MNLNVAAAHADTLAAWAVAWRHEPHGEVMAPLLARASAVARCVAENKPIPLEAVVQIDPDINEPKQG